MSTTVNTPEIVAAIAQRFNKVQPFDFTAKKLIERKTAQVVGIVETKDLTISVGVYSTKGEYKRFGYCSETQETFHF